MDESLAGLSEGYHEDISSPMHDFGVGTGDDMGEILGV